MTTDIFADLASSKSTQHPIVDIRVALALEPVILLWHMDDFVYSIIKLLPRTHGLGYVY